MNDPPTDSLVLYCTFTYVLAGIASTTLLAALVPFFNQLEHGFIVFLDKYKRLNNPTGAVVVKGGLFTATHDMPEGNFNCGIKRPGSTVAVRGLFITEDQIMSATRADIVLRARTHEVHMKTLRVVRDITIKSHQEQAATQAGVCPEIDTKFVESIACNCPHQWSQVRDQF